METDRLEQAIHHAVAETAAPDASHLAAILARLEQVPAARPLPRKSAWPWLLLAAAGAAVAGGGYWYAQQRSAHVALPPAADSLQTGGGMQSLPLHQDTPQEFGEPPDRNVPTTPTTSNVGENEGRSGRDSAIVYRR
jgi:hypothetical protein